MIIEKVFKCCAYGCKYGEVDSLVIELAKEIKQGYHILKIDMIPSMSMSANEINKEPDLIITLRKIEG